jgi:ferredoxin
MRVRVDAEKCVGHGRCYELAPEVYAEDDRGHCCLRRETVPPDHEKLARLGAENCPEDAITIEET